MFTKIVLFAVLAACGIQSDQTTSPDVQLGGDPEESAKAVAAARDWLDRQMQMQRQSQMQAVSNPDEKEPPPERPLEDGQHFCCDTINHEKQTGDGCVTIGPSHVELCPNVLYCSGNWSKTEDGHAQCND
jgi:hypothetical protein